jgi:hypothetical protein
VYLLWMAIASSDLALEIPGVGPNIYKYYGKEPFTVFHFPMHWAWMNGTSFLVVGFLVWLLAPRLHGWRQILFLFATPLGFTASYGIVGWPAFLALNAKLSNVTMHIVDLGSLALSLLVVYGIAKVVIAMQPEAATQAVATPSRLGVSRAGMVAPA